MCSNDSHALVRVTQIRGNRIRVELASGLLERFRSPCDERELVAVLAERASDREPKP
jgi:hypothetical protein